jgi:tetratricopeptide (TPR) repeat protein
MNKRVVASWLLLSAMALASACQREEPTAQCAEALPAQIEDAEVRMYLSRLKAAHELADVAIERGDRAAAIEGLEKAAATHGANMPAPAREATADTLARLAELHAGEGAFDAAMSAVDEGLELADKGSYMHGRLLEVRGGVELARADEQPAARLSAAESFEQAIAVQGEVVERARACAATSDVVNVGLVSFLSLAEATHRLADLAEGENEIAGAEHMLRALAEGPLPTSSKTELPAEAREVLADTHARLADLESARHDFGAARRDIEMGLELAIERNHYRGRLMEVLGTLEDRLHVVLQEDGRSAAAEEAKKRAIKAFEEAVAIQDEVIRSTLEEPR